MASFCDESDVYAVVPSGSIPNGGRLCASALAATDAFELDAHGFALDTPLRFRAEEGGSLPTGISAGTTYYAIPVNESSFKVSATAGGAAVNLTADGSLVLAIRDRPIALAIEKASEDVAQELRGSAIPAAAPYPIAIRSATALLAARYLRVWAQRDAVELQPLIDAAMRQLERWRKGQPIQGTNAPAPTRAAVARSAATEADPRGWAPTGGTLP